MLKYSRSFGLIVLLALACGNDSPQAPPAESFSPELLRGRWNASVPEYRFFTGREFNNLSGQITFDSETYVFNLFFQGADTLNLDFSESGFWHWDIENAQFLFFEYQQTKFEISNRVENRGQTLTDRTFSSDSNGAWYCKYKFDKEGLTLFEANGKGGARFEKIILTMQ